MKQTVNVLGIDITPLSWQETFHFVAASIEEKRSEYVCCCTVHTVMETQNDVRHRQAVNSATLKTTDGMPLLWLAKAAGFKDAERICGPDLMLKLCEISLEKGYRHYFYGGAEGVAKQLAEELQGRYPGLQVAGYYFPPYRELTEEEDQEIIKLISEARADFIWIGLGTPKQDIWMARHKDKFSGIMFGVGAAFDFYTGRIKRAPVWMRKGGLEWLHRLFSEPKRLWKRYSIYNLSFVLQILISMLRGKRQDGRGI